MFQKKEPRNVKFLQRRGMALLKDGERSERSARPHEL